MDIKQQVTIWVEKNLGKKISKDLKKMIKEEDSAFDVEAYINDLYDDYFSESEVEKIMKKEIFHNSNDIFKSYDSDNSSEVDYFSQELFEFEPNDFQSFSEDEIIRNLKSNSKEMRVKCLQQLASYADDLISYASWNLLKTLLQNFLKTSNDRDVQISTLKVFQKLLFCYNKPQIVCESFVCISEIFLFHTDVINSEHENVPLEEIYDLKTNKLVNKKNFAKIRKLNKYDAKFQKPSDSELSLKLMFLLIESQKQMPEKWICFSEKKLREIIFNFINLLSSTISSESESLSGLELLSILNPTAKWSQHWCHTSTGRILLCAALRKYKSLFIHIIENIIINVKTRKTLHLKNKKCDRSSSRLSATNNDLRQSHILSDKSINENEKTNYNLNERNKCVYSAPNLSRGAETNKTKTCKKSEIIIGNIPRKVAELALFCHNISLVSCLVQYRSGRSLFPLQIHFKKRLLNVQDLISLIINYLENFENGTNISVTQVYQQHILNIVETLKSVQTILSSRGMSAQRYEVLKK